MFDVILKQIKTNSGDSDSLAMAIFGIGASLNAKNILELGVRCGRTTLPLLCVAEENNGKLTSVDIDCEAESNAIDFVKSKTTEINIESNWDFHLSDAIEFLNHAVEKGEYYDLVYVDDWHSYEHVKNELLLLDKLISPKSIILIHDTMYANYEPHYHTDISCKVGQWANGGPYRAVAELDPNFWEFSTIPISNGLTILRKKYSKIYNTSK